MDPITIGALASGGGSILSGLFGNKANKENAAIARENLALQREALEYAKEEAARQQAEAKLGTTDAAGNRTYFIPGKGWVTDLTLPQMMLQRMTQGEQMRQLQQEAPRNERMNAAAATARMNEGDMSDAAMAELRGVRKEPVSELRQLLMTRAMEGRNEAADRAGGVAARAAVRSGGGTNAAELMQSARAASDMDAYRKAGMDAELAARDASASDYASGRDAASSLYDYFRRASTTGATPVSGYTPTGPAMRSTAMADQAAINLAGKSVDAPYTQPNLALPDTLNDLGQLWMSVGKYRDNQAMDDKILNSYGTPILPPQDTQRRASNSGAF